MAFQLGDLVTGTCGGPANPGSVSFTGRVKRFASGGIIVADSTGVEWWISPSTARHAVPGVPTGASCNPEPPFPAPPAQGLAPATARPTIAFDITFTTGPAVTTTMPKKPTGHHCAHCREYYEYAEAPSGRLVCYSCRSSGRR